MKRFALFVEGKEELTLTPLPYKKHDLEPVMSADTLNYHHDHLAGSYVNRFNKGEGDPTFNKHGAYLHNIYFPQFQPPKANNKPFGISEQVINKKWGSFKEFQDNMEKQAMKIQGSGWIYMSVTGTVIDFPNHSQMPTDIALLIDWWEHAWALDYHAEKKEYLKNIWRIVDWQIVNDRINNTPL